jgi:hypothetical protein
VGLRDKWAGRVGWAGDGREKKKKGERRKRSAGPAVEKWVRGLGLLFFFFFKSLFQTNLKVL